MKDKQKIAVGVLVVIFLVFSWWVSDIPIGYYQFKQMCEKEGGLRTYAKVEPGVGWLTEGESYAQYVVSSYPEVPFARFRSNDGKWQDVRYKGGNPWWSSSYETTAASSNSTQYRFEYERAAVTDAIRLNRVTYKLLDEYSGGVLFKVTRFYFTWTIPEHTLLGRSDSATCPEFEETNSQIKAFLKIKD